MKYDIELIQKINLFEKITKARVKNALYFKEKLTFIVEPGEMGKALGKKKANIMRIQKLMNEKIKIAEYDPEKTQFIVNFLNPLKVKNIEEDDGVVTINGEDHKTNGLIIGRNAQSLRQLEEVVKNYFDIKEIKVE